MRSRFCATHPLSSITDVLVRNGHSEKLLVLAAANKEPGAVPNSLPLFDSPLRTAPTNVTRDLTVEAHCCSPARYTCSGCWGTVLGQHTSLKGRKEIWSGLRHFGVTRLTVVASDCRDRADQVTFTML